MTSDEPKQYCDLVLRTRDAFAELPDSVRTVAVSLMIHYLYELMEIETALEHPRWMKNEVIRKRLQ